MGVGIFPRLYEIPHVHLRIPYIVSKPKEIPNRACKNFSVEKNGTLQFLLSYSIRTNYSHGFQNIFSEVRESTASYANIRF